MNTSFRLFLRSSIRLAAPAVGLILAVSGLAQNLAPGAAGNAPAPNAVAAPPPVALIPFPTNTSQYRRWAWAYRQRAYPLDVIPLGVKEAALQQIEQSGSGPSAANEAGQWVNIGPAPILNGQVAPTAAVSGRVTSIAVDPGNAAHWIIGTGMGGVWETVNSGATWVPRTDDQPALAIGAVAFAPGNPSVMFAGTGEPNGSDSYAGAGMLKSTDGGQTWRVFGTTTFSNTSITAVRVNPGNANNLVVSTAPDRSFQLYSTGSSPLAPLPVNGVYLSTDGATNWSRRLTGPVMALEVHPSNFQNQYAAIADIGTGTILVGGTQTIGAIHRSQDGGNSWSLLTGPWGNQAVVRIAVAISPSNPNTVYVCVAKDQSSLAGIWRSDNAWSGTPTWTALPTVTSAAKQDVGQLGYNLAISVDPVNPSVLYFGEVAVWRYNGTTWSTLAGHYDAQVNGTKIHSDQHAFAWAGSRLLVGNDGGVWSTTDAGNSFSAHNNTLSTIQFYHGSVHPQGASVALGGQQDNGSARWTGNSGWSFAGYGDGADNGISPSNPDTKWAVSSQNLSVRRVSNGGQNLETMLLSLNDQGVFPNAPFIGRLAFSPANENIMIAGTTRLLKCVNFFSVAAPTTIQDLVNIWSLNGPEMNSHITALAFAKSDASGNTYAFGTANGELRLTSQGGGSSWVNIDAGNTVPNRFVTQVAFHPQNANVLYVTLSGFNQGTPGKSGHVFKTANALATSPTWVNVSPPVNLPHNAIAVDPSNPNNVYVGTDIGVWHSADAGGSWTHMGPGRGMPNVAVFDLEIQPGSGKVFAFTHGRGALLFDPSTTTVPPTITSYNPTNGPPLTTVTIRGTKLDEVTAVRFNNVNAAFTLGTATNLTATVPAGATTGLISVTTPSGTANSANNFVVTPGPNISSFTPASGNIGTVVTITGANFTGATSVTFNGVAASFTVNSPTQITATVPSGAATGRIAVTTPAGSTQTGGNFALITTPVISSFNPTTAGAGAAVVIQGANLTGATSVTFNNVAASFTVNSAAQITATVPGGATTGPIRVTTALGTGTSANDFVVIPAPVISGFTPTSGVADFNVNISGSNLTGATNVTFNNVVARFTVNSASQITAKTPIGITTGPVRVTTPGGTGVSALSFTVLPPPANDNFATPQDISGNSGTASGNNTAATKETGEPFHASNQGGKSIWYRWTAPANGLWSFDTLNAGINTLLGVYTGANVTALSGVATNDDIPGSIVSRVFFSATSGTTYRIVVDGFRTDEMEFGEGGDISAGPVTLNWTLANNVPPVISNFTPGSGFVGSSVVINGTNLFGATSVTFNNTAAAFTVESLTRIVAVVPGGATTGLLRVTTPGGTATSAGNFTVVSGPGNDNFANASVLSGTNGVVTGSNEGGTLEAGEPQHAGRPGGRSVWYSWTAPANGTWRFDTHGSSFDTALAVYTGADVNALSLIGSNDDFGAVVTSQTTFPAVAGTVYRLAVDGINGAGGNVVLNWSYVLALPQISNFNPGSGPAGTAVSLTGTNLTGATSVRFNGANAGFTVNSPTLITATVPPGAATGPLQVTTPNGVAASAGSFVVAVAPPNDNFANALVVVSNAVVVGGNIGATKETSEPSHAANPGGRSIWYRWVAPSTGPWSIDTVGSSFDTTLGVYTGGSVAGLSLVISDDDSGGDRTSHVIINAVAGTTYRIAVDGYNGDSGNVVLRVTSTTPPSVVYYTQFEPGFPEFYNTFGFLAGQNGWQMDGTGANGFVFDYLYGLGYGAYLGFSPANATATYLWTPINHNPDTNTRPVLTFSTYMQIVDSTVNRWDDFEWQVYNSNADRLFSLNFDNANLGIYYQLSSGGYTDTGTTFQNGTLYQLIIMMDFGRNEWSALLYDGVTYTTLAEHLPISNSGLARNLGDVDAVWLPRGALAGDNYLVFDEYLIVASPSQYPRILQQPRSKTVAPGVAANLSVTATGVELMSYQWRFNGAPIPGATQPVLTLNSVNPAQAGTYSVIVSNSEGFVISSNAALTVSIPLADALDTLNLNWTTDSEVGWFGQTATTHDGVDAAQSGAALDTQEAWMQTTVAGPGQLTFWWKVSSESNFDYLEFYLDGVLQSGRISGEVNWQQKSYNLNEGLHTLRWRYAKDELVAQGQDRAWVDQVTLHLPPTIAAQPQSQSVGAGQSATFNVTANGSPPLGYQWRFNGANLGGAVGSGYTRSNVQTAHAGSYSVVVTNSAGAVTSAVAALTISASAPRPALFAPVVTSSNVVITWMSVSGRVYQLQYKDSLTNANWTPLMPNVTANGSVASKTDVSVGVQRYYRVELQP